MEEADAGGGEKGDNPAGVTGHIGHLGSDGLAAEPAVEFLREFETGGEEGRVHQFAVDGKGESVPGEVPGDDGVLHAAASVELGVFQVLVDQPGPGRPDEALGALGLAEDLGVAECPGDEAGEIVGNDVPGEIGETDVEVSLEDEMNLVDLV